MPKQKQRYSHEELAVAYSELTTSAFASLIKLLSVGERKIKRKSIPKILNLSRSQTTRILKELRLNGYIDIKKIKIGTTSIVEIIKTLVIRRNFKFICR